MQSDFQFSTGEETGATAVNEAYLKGLYAGMHFSSVSSCWSTPFFGGGVAAFHSFSPTPVEKVGLVPYENLYGFSPEMETPPEMSFRKQDDRNFTGVFDLQKFSGNVYTGATDGEIYPTVQMSGLPHLESFEQHRLFKSQPQTPVTTMFSPLINFPLTEPSSSASASAAAKSQSKPVKTTRRSSSKRSSYQTSSASAREGDRRRRLSDKTRCLQNLIPGGNKMDIATMLQEAYKYIKFLQAQAIALHSMPLLHHHGGAYAGPPPPPDDAINVNINSGLEAVGKLNRQQLLKLMVNSPMAQTVLYRRGCCIYSVEQLNYLRQLAG